MGATYTEHKGLDASHYQAGELDMHAAAAAGIDFWFEKATEGLGVDPAFADRQPRIREVFPVRGWYHFVRSDGIDPTEQGQHVRNTVGDLQPNEYVVFDIEDGCGLSGADGIAYLIAMIGTAGYTDDQVMIYTSLGWAQGVFGDSLSRLTDFHLWAARYAAGLGDVSPWSAALAWQYGQYGTVPGVGGASIDTDAWLDGHWPIAA